jgi:hypothetical protein
MQRILLAVLAVAWFQVAVRAEENDAPEVTLANLEMESQEIVAIAELGDLLRTNWNLKGVEAGTMFRGDNSRFQDSTPAASSVNLETQIATGVWLQRISVAKVEYLRCGPTTNRIPSTLSTFDMKWLTDAVWPLTRSYVRQDTDHDAQTAVFSFFY